MTATLELENTVVEVDPHLINMIDPALARNFNLVPQLVFGQPLGSEARLGFNATRSNGRLAERHDITVEVYDLHPSNYGATVSQHRLTGYRFIMARVPFKPRYGYRLRFRRPLGA
jgi:hypothetical protein